MTDKQIPCIVCGTEPEGVGPFQPYGATEFVTHGHYGSTAFDPMDGSLALIINVCDGHLREHRDRVMLRERLPQPTPFDYRPWA